MKVVCISNKCMTIEVGETYDVINEDDYRYEIINDYGVKCWREKEMFKSLSEIRNEKIDKLLENESSVYR